MSEIEAILKGINDVNTFVRERWDPVEKRVQAHGEEIGRLRREVRSVVDAQREGRRAALSGASERDVRVVRVVGGKYDGFTLLDMAIVRSVLNAHLRNPHGYSGRGLNMLREWEANFKKAMDSTTAGAGDELVPTLEANELWQDVNLQTAVASLFPTIPMPSNPFDIPIQLGDFNWYPGTANVATTSSDPATSKRTLTAFELAAAVAWAYELDEDAVIAMMPQLRESLVRNAAEVLDDVVLNADTTATNNINADGATISASDAGKAHWLIGFDGLLHVPLVDNTGQAVNHNAVVSDDLFNEVRSKLGKYGIRPSQCAYVMDVNTYIRAQGVTNFRTLDKLGPNATLLTGQLGMVEGIPVIVSEQMRLADTDGKVTDAGNGTDTGRVLMVNRTQFYKGFRRELLIETERDIQKRQNLMVASMRVGFDGRAANASDTSVAVAYDITGVAA